MDLNSTLETQIEVDSSDVISCNISNCGRSFTKRPKDLIKTNRMKKAAETLSETKEEDRSSSVAATLFNMTTIGAQVQGPRFRNRLTCAMDATNPTDGDKRPSLIVAARQSRRNSLVHLSAFWATLLAVLLTVLSGKRWFDAEGKCLRPRTDLEFICVCGCSQKV